MFGRSKKPVVESLSDDRTLERLLKARKSGSYVLCELTGADADMPMRVETTEELNEIAKKVRQLTWLPGQRIE